ncbi:hypothetical protein P7K49_028723 [Saguinus oedipus]|uniref:Uncharacterized protein n=1 Tax=Saguinus oedipus TaxID=9490 RepID=A0ABQ9U554_SAGOE|nr:hypothetical protein P7K49_028723 [Saguinus oedipus]
MICQGRGLATKGLLLTLQSAGTAAAKRSPGAGRTGGAGPAGSRDARPGSARAGDPRLSGPGTADCIEPSVRRHGLDQVPAVPGRAHARYRLHQHTIGKVSLGPTRPAGPWRPRPSFSAFLHLGPAFLGSACPLAPESWAASFPRPFQCWRPNLSTSLHDLGEAPGLVPTSCSSGHAGRVTQ